MRPLHDRASDRGRSALCFLGALLCTVPAVDARAGNPSLDDAAEPWQAKWFPKQRHPAPLAQRSPSPEDWDGKIPFKIVNQCEDTIWPAITTQAGTGPGTGGFELVAGNSTQLWVAPNWQGRIWGRTNCTVDGDSARCSTGDCQGKMSCEASGATPATLAEFTLEGGFHNEQTFYDISLVDGYNIPIGLVYVPSENTTFIPPNLTNGACIATPGWLHTPDGTGTGTYYANESYPVPLEDAKSNDNLQRWCPWPLLKYPPPKPGDGVYPYPDDDIERPVFSPCNSACAATGKDADCCEGDWRDPEKCKPGRYSNTIKAICPDAYSFAFDDQKSTFIIPKGGGWEVVLCPKGRSTNILRQLGAEMDELNTNGHLSDASLRRLRDVGYLTRDTGAGTELRPLLARLLGVAVAAALWAAL